MRSKQAHVTLDEKYSSNANDTSTLNTDEKAIQISPYQILFVLNVRESLLMTAMDVIESGDVQAAAAYEQVLNEVNEWVETYRIKQSTTKVEAEQIEEGDK